MAPPGCSGGSGGRRPAGRTSHSAAQQRTARAGAAAAPPRVEARPAARRPTTRPALRQRRAWPTSLELPRRRDRPAPRRRRAAAPTRGGGRAQVPRPDTASADAARSRVCAPNHHQPSRPRPGVDHAAGRRGTRRDQRAATAMPAAGSCTGAPARRPARPAPRQPIFRPRRYVQPARGSGRRYPAATRARRSGTLPGPARPSAQLPAGRAGRSALRIPEAARPGRRPRLPRGAVPHGPAAAGRGDRRSQRPLPRWQADGEARALAHRRSRPRGWPPCASVSSRTTARPRPAPGSAPSGAW